VCGEGMALECVELPSPEAGLDLLTRWIVGRISHLVGAQDAPAVGRKKKTAPRNYAKRWEKSGARDRAREPAALAKR